MGASRITGGAEYMVRKLEYIMLREEDGGRAEYGPEQEDDGRIRLVCAGASKPWACKNRNQT